MILDYTMAKVGCLSWAFGQIYMPPSGIWTNLNAPPPKIRKF